MADYSNFPFGDFTVAEIFALARESRDIGDEEFVKACMEAIRLNKCRSDDELPAKSDYRKMDDGSMGEFDWSE